jgi:hypothetical protein
LGRLAFVHWVCVPAHVADLQRLPISIYKCPFIF